MWSGFRSTLEHVRVDIDASERKCEIRKTSLVSRNKMADDKMK
jgi:hypothetical protein